MHETFFQIPFFFEYRIISCSVSVTGAQTHENFHDLL